MVGSRSLVQPLRQRDFLHLVAANALWWWASFMEMVAFGWIVLEMTNSPWMVAMVGFARSLPFLIVGFVGGAVTERFGRRPVILFAQGTNAVLYGAILVASLLGVLTIWQMVVASLVLGGVWALDWPARRSLMPDLVGKQHVVEALLVENFAQGFARILGPLTAGWLLASLGSIGCMAAIVLTSLVAFGLLWRLARQPVPRTNLRPVVSPWSVLGNSLRYVGSNRTILGVMLITVVVNLLLISYMTMLPVFARDVLGQGPAGLGMLGASAGIGVFLGLLLTNVARRYTSNGWILVVGVSGMALALMIFSQSASFGLSWLMLFAAGIGQACFGIMQSSIILLTASDEMRGHTMGVLVLAIGADPLGKLQTGALADWFGAPVAVGVQALMGLIAMVIIGLALPELRARPGPAPATE